MTRARRARATALCGLAALLLATASRSAVAGVAHDDDPNAPRDVRAFVAPRARCAASTPARLVTSVGTWRTAHARFEVVADVELTEHDPLGAYGDPSLTIFDANCRAVWREERPDDGEIAFRLLDATDGPLLLLASRTVFEPVDGVIVSFDVLVPDFDGVRADTPVPLVDDRKSRAFVGPLGPDHALTIIAVPDLTDFMGRDNPHPHGVLFRWSRVGPVAAATSAFVGPRVLDRRALLRLRAVVGSNSPSFPLTDFVFPDGRW